MTVLQRARVDIGLVVRGLTADGVTPLDSPVSFPRDEATLEAVATALYLFYVCVAHQRPALLEQPRVRTVLALNLLSHLLRTGHVRSHQVELCNEDAAKAGTFLCRHPELIEAPPSFAELVARYESCVGRSRRTPGKHTCVPPRLPLWASGPYTLHSLFHPLHLVEEIQVLGHCVGTRAEPGDAIVAVNFRQLIQSGTSRVYSLAHLQKPVCTLLVALNPPTLTECAGRWGSGRLREQAYFPALVEAIAHLGVLHLGLRFDNTLGLSAPDILSHCDPDTRAALAATSSLPSGEPPEWRP